ncbi:MAG: nitrate- and nitrite sensing domain-containing protein [Arcobacteraceae bacterium]
MLKKFSIKQKLILLMMIPLIVVIVLSGELAYQSYTKKASLDKIEQVVILSTKIGALVHETQKERGMTAGYLGSKGTKFVTKLPQQRENANDKKIILLDFLKNFDRTKYDDEFQQLLAQSLDQLSKIETIRNSVTSQTISTGEAIGYYTKMNSLFLNVIGSSIHLSLNANLSQKLTSYTNFLLSKERAGIERAVGSNTFARDNFGIGMSSKFISLVAQQDAYADSFLKVASHDAKEFFNTTLQGDAVNEVKRMREILFSKHENFGIEAQYWFDTITSKINLLKKVEDYLAQEILEATQKENDALFNITVFYALLSIVGIAVTLILSRTIAFTILFEVKDLRDELNDFFAFINFEKDDLNIMVIDSDDELGKMSRVINDNIEKTKHNIKTDKDLIQETIQVADRINKGHLGTRIEKHSNNPQLNNLKDIINEMLNNMQNNIGKVMDVLTSYSKLDYRPTVDKGDLEGTLATLCEDVNILGDAITKTLMNNKQNGLTLKQSSQTLLNNVDILNKNSNSAAASLEETAAAVEEVTSNITLTTNNISQMAKNATDVIKASEIGNKLANDTTQAMDEINDEVTAIKEAITIIDQIAFQTNILSLNAAVEAATAGEAGKGFAVVAQEVRNLAARSAEAANEIKQLVENATAKANSGKQISDQMIHGYTDLNTSISKTTSLIEDVETASKEQLLGIKQINNAVNLLDQQTQQNASIASQTYDVAINTDKIAQLVVEDADQKEFRGK